jgi:hypothetical protein
VPSEDPFSLSQAIIELGTSTGLRERMGTVVRDHVCTHYSVPAILEKWNRVLIDAAGTPSRGDSVRELSRS